MRTTRLVAAALLAVSAALTSGLAACASGGSSAATPTGTRRSGDVITREELESVQVPSMDQVIQRLHPNWLTSRGPISIASPNAGNPVVYLDDTRLGGIETLQTIQPAEIVEVRRLNAADATNRFGMNHAGGAIVLKRRVGGG